MLYAYLTLGYGRGLDGLLRLVFRRAIGAECLRRRRLAVLVCAVCHAVEVGRAKLYAHHGALSLCRGELGAVGQAGLIERDGVVAELCGVVAYGETFHVVGHGFTLVVNVSVLPNVRHGVDYGVWIALPYHTAAHVERVVVEHYPRAADGCVVAVGTGTEQQRRSKDC